MTILQSEMDNRVPVIVRNIYSNVNRNVKSNVISNENKIADTEVNQPPPPDMPIDLSMKRRYHELYCYRLSTGT